MVAWFCDVGGTMLRFGDGSVVLQTIAMIEQAARRFGRGEADAGARADRHGRRSGSS